MFDSRHAADERDKLFPTLLLDAQRFSPLGRQAVVATPPLVSLLDPPSNDPPVLLESMEQRIKRSHMKSELAAGSDLYELRDVVPMSRLIFQHREDEKLSAALLPLRVMDARHRPLDQSRESPQVGARGQHTTDGGNKYGQSLCPETERICERLRIREPAGLSRSEQSDCEKESR